MKDWRAVAKEAAYQATLDEIRERWGQETPAYNYRWEHVQAVARIAVPLAKAAGADIDVVEAAAWLHDLCKRGPDDNHGTLGAEAARKVLTQTDFPPAKIELVTDAIAKHVGLYTDHPVEPLEAAVLWDADKLTKVGSTALLQFTGYQIALGDGALEDWIDNLTNQSWQDLTLQSFHTREAKEAGAKRLQAYRAFCQQLILEFNGDDLGEIEPKSG
ncbi:MAG: HD domain-containing protein [Chloroflexota bacterium]